MDEGGGSGTPRDPEEISKATNQAAAAPGRAATSRAKSGVEQIVAALIDDESIARVRQNQDETLTKLNDAANRIATMTKATADAHAKNAAEFVRAARVAKTIRDDLESASRRLAAIQKKLHQVRARQAVSASQQASAPRESLDDQHVTPSVRESVANATSPADQKAESRSPTTRAPR